ncbi:MAG: Fic family protein [Candidatus Izemoplasmatales bacterium]
MSRSGSYRQNHFGKISYLSFFPNPLPPFPPIQIDDELNLLLMEAHLVIGRLDGISKLLPNQDLFLSLYVRKEALLSSQIEGTMATLEDIFDPHLLHAKKNDVEDVSNVVRAVHMANELRKSLPLSLRFFREIHGILLHNVRGFEKQPGNFRTTQNWIGPPGSIIKNAEFIPPNVGDMNEALSKLEEYIHTQDVTNRFVKIALIHYQFETIHPFLDGNGRVGRMLIGLLMKEYHLLHEDTFYLSYYLKRNRQEYYDRLMEVRTKGLYEEWVRFFVKGIIETAYHALDTIDSLLDLHAQNEAKVAALDGKFRVTSMLLFEYIEHHPIFDISMASQELSKSFGAISKAVQYFETCGILKQIKGNERYRVYIYDAYLTILRDGT